MKTANKTPLITTYQQYVQHMQKIAHICFPKTHQWLKNQVFIYEKNFNCLELCNISTGKPFKTSVFIWYLENKFRIHYQTQPTQG